MRPSRRGGEGDWSAGMAAESSAMAFRWGIVGLGDVMKKALAAFCKPPSELAAAYRRSGARARENANSPRDLLATEWAFPTLGHPLFLLGTAISLGLS